MEQCLLGLYQGVFFLGKVNQNYLPGENDPALWLSNDYTTI